MLDYKTIIQFRRSGLSLNEIASRLNCKWDSVQRVIVRCENYWGSLDGVPENFTNEQIADAIFKARKSIDPDYLQPDAERILERQRQGLLRNELWTEYCAEAAKAGKKAYRLSRFNEIVSEYKTQHDISFTVQHTPGLDAQADWTGDLGHFVDMDTGELVDVHVFVMTLPYSGYFYAEGFLNEQMQNWLDGHAHAFAFFGGAPTFVVPDNCATAVDRRHFDERGILNTRYVEFLSHYNVIPKPTRVRRPKDKGHVERHVHIVEQDIIRVMNRLDISSLREFNEILLKKVAAVNARPYSKKLGSRTEIFESEEKETLLVLPVVNYRVYDEKEASVGRDFHIQYCSAFYSVPVRYVGSKVTVRATADTVYIYDKEKRLIAEHRRAIRKWQRQTLLEHIPNASADLHGAYSTEGLMNWARRFGSYTERWVKNELKRFEFEVQAYRPIISVLHALDAHSSSVAEAASKAAVESAVYSVKGFKSILSVEAKHGAAAASSKTDLNDLFCSHGEEDTDGWN